MEDLEIQNLTFFSELMLIDQVAGVRTKKKVKLYPEKHPWDMISLCCFLNELDNFHRASRRFFTNFMKNFFGTNQIMERVLICQVIFLQKFSIDVYSFALVVYEIMTNHGKVSKHDELYYVSANIALLFSSKYLH